MSKLTAFSWTGTKSRTLSMSQTGQWKTFCCQPIVFCKNFEFSIKIKKYSQPAGSGFLSIGVRGIGGFGEEDYVWLDSSSPGFKKGDLITVIVQKEKKEVMFKKNGRLITQRSIDVDHWPVNGFEIRVNSFHKGKLQLVDFKAVFPEEIRKKKEKEETKKREEMERRLIEEEKEKEKERQEKLEFEQKVKGTELQKKVDELLIAFEKLRTEHEELKMEHENTKNELQTTRLTLEEVKSDYLEFKENHKNTN